MTIWVVYSDSRSHDYVATYATVKDGMLCLINDPAGTEVVALFAPGFWSSVSRVGQPEAKAEAA